MGTILNYQHANHPGQNSMSHQSWSTLGIGICHLKSISDLKYYRRILAPLSSLTAVLGSIKCMCLKLNKQAVL